MTSVGKLQHALLIAAVMLFGNAAIAQQSDEFKDGYAQGYRASFDAGYSKGLAGAAHRWLSATACAAIPRPANARSPKSAICAAPWPKTLRPTNIARHTSPATERRRDFFWRV